MADFCPGFRTTYGGDVIRDGMYLELVNDDSNDVVAEVFCADVDGTMRISLYRWDLPLDVFERFIAEAKRVLAHTN